MTSRTIHSAKGAGADHVIVPGLTFGGLPSTVEDDPLLDVAQPAAEMYPFAEERRLFYVALTRARRTVLLLSVDGRESPFLLELATDRHLVLEAADGKPIRSRERRRGPRLPPVVICPGCRSHRMVVREGPHGTFYGCRGFPLCKRTVKIKKR